MKFYICVLAAFLIAMPFSALAQTGPIVELDTGVPLYDVDWRPDGQLLAVASETGVRIFDSSLQQITQLTGHTSTVASVSWSPDGEQLASSGGPYDHTVKIWNHDPLTNTFTLDRTLEGYGTDDSLVFLVAWSPDGDYLASLSLLGGEYTRSELSVGAVGTWNTSTWNRTQNEPLLLFEPARALAWNPDSSAVAVLTSSGVTVINPFNNDFLYFSNSTPLQTWEIPYGLDWSISDQIATTGSVTVDQSGPVASFSGGIVIRGASTYQTIYQLTQFSAGPIVWNGRGTQFAVHGTDNAGTNDPSRLMIVHPATGVVTRFFDGAPLVWALDWSFDDTRIASVNLNGIIQLWDTSNLSDPVGIPTLLPPPTLTPSQTPIITPTPTIILTPTSTPTPMNKFAFTSEIAGNPSQLFTSDLTGTNIISLSVLTGESIAPSWSRDGRYIAYASRPDENSPYQIYRVNADGTGLLLLPPNTSSNYDPAWSPDGQRIVFTLERFGNKEIYWILADGTMDSIGRLADDPAEDYQPDWSLQNSIAFVSTRATSASPDIYSMNLLGGNLRHLTNTPNATESHPTWSPDGTKIAFIATQNGVSRLNIMNADGTNRMEYIEIADVPFDWSPDGSQLIIISPENTINIFEPATGYNIVILNDTNPKFGVTWSNGQGSVALPSPTATPSAHARYTAGPPAPASPYPASATP